MSKYSVP